MTVLQSIFLGIVQGLTEFLPVSSSGHLALMQKVFHIETGESVLFETLLHLATLLVIIVYFRKEIGRLIAAFFGIIADLFRNISIRLQNRKAITKAPLRNVLGTNYRRFAVMLILSTIPTGVIGIIGRDVVAQAAESLLVVGICLLVSGALLFYSDRLDGTGKIPADMTVRDGLLIGIAQGLATLPGLSRSGSTITAALLCGLTRSFAVMYSFILSIPAVVGATVLEIGDVVAEGVDTTLIPVYAAGMIAAAVVGSFCIRAMLALFRRHRMRFIACYCFAAGVFAIAANFFIS